MIKLGSLTFQWPSMLWLLVILPVVLISYFYATSHRRTSAVAYPDLEVIGEKPGVASAFRRYVPAALMFCALAAMLLSIARPQAVISLPARVETVVLALDMSGSMRATDVKPTRFAAAQSAAKSFIADQPRHVRVGVVAVAGTAAVVQSPTHNRDDLSQAIDRLQPQRGTALGSGLIISLATLLPDARIDVEKLIDGARPSGSARKNSSGAVAGGSGKAESNGKPKADPGSSIAGAAGEAVPPGSNGSAVIVLLSDGLSNTGPEVAAAIDVANEYGVRVYTVGVGTAEGATVTADGWSMKVKLDEDGLRKIASSTGAEYFRATNASELKKIYRFVSAKLALEKQSSTEITSVFVALGAAMAMLAALFSMMWFNRIL